MTRNNPSLCIEETVQGVWADAGYDQPASGIVPLFEIIANYPIWISEVENLTQSRAINFLTEMIRQAPNLEAISDDPLSGFFYAYQFRGNFLGAILIEKHDSVVRRRFSIAHELGHYKLHYEPFLEQLNKSGSSEGLLITDEMIYKAPKDDSIDLTIGGGAASQLQMGEMDRDTRIIIDETKEVEANQFAASLLIPDGVLRERIAAFHLSLRQPHGFLASRLASEFLVSKEAMAYRLAAIYKEESSWA